MTLDVTLGAAFVAGLLSFLSPCILPLVPPFLCYMAGVSVSDLSDGQPALRPRILVSALAFVAGFSLVFVALGSTASIVGRFISAHISTLGIVAGALIVLMGLHFLGVLRIPLLYRSATLQVENRPAGVAGAFVMGLAFAFGWTPCAGPILAAVLFMAGSEDTTARGALLLLSYSAGTGIPFLIAAAFTGRFVAALGRARRHLALVEKTMGAFLVATGLMFLTGLMPAVSEWLLQHFPALTSIG
ncbi:MULTISPECIES: cytochrome c biogenesis CcdA family protein [unclassified Bradyrhizobium]|uniref:cytochrome c biogenesis CcdA family protein n=1 Tax=unclassified Bradyrhizobium TaxID=2631580 RepID=UPI00211DB442|nr:MULTISPECIES: cytochrome c biogenesis protein CcdA [unclassified Bradyrhizobium]MDD1532908.1 cytochrome C biogenesis protein [Bradyrhizobium sp. WBOS8]MDD1581820.1 cytochrome C biogenesis protein [Bradyrhizobium sp. WBOS4]UUO50075.1 cytochrome C biogenesis protein [Bradyrhizobium sp. WBOS04]UUO58843.1 cytochrome C biogenesis protein [Bradyrhizobium sp. WBOS08]